MQNKLLIITLVIMMIMPIIGDFNNVKAEVFKASSSYDYACPLDEYEVDYIEDDGSFTKVSCHSHFENAKNKMKENPDYVVFNGQEGSMSGEHALKAKVGDKVRLFVGNAGPNLASSFHIMGKTLDVVRVEGGSLENHDVQTTLIPPGSATIIDLTMTTPGEYMFLDHSIMRTMKGASGDIFVTGRQDPAIFTGQTAVKPYTKSE
ncbi:MAG: multicopper oxidase domain-containing protein [Veillonella sp.]|nr:multicopper oxidase domain-containing protein [Veillonella sp.]